MYKDNSLVKVMVGLLLHPQHNNIAPLCLDTLPISRVFMNHRLPQLRSIAKMTRLIQHMYPQLQDRLPQDML